MRDLIFSPHDDDALIGCSSLLDGSVVVIVTDGSLGYTSLGQKDDIATIRREEAELAYKIYETQLIRLELPDMSLNPYECFKLPDGRVGLYNLFIKVIRNFRPRRIFVPNILDEHPDHQVVHRAALVAVKQASSSILPDLGMSHKVEEVLQYEVWNQVENRILANQVDLKKKRKALGFFRSQGSILEEIPPLNQKEYFQI